MKSTLHVSEPADRNLLSRSVAGDNSLGVREWSVLLAAALGWMFDGVEMGLFPIAARPALQDLLKITDDAQVGPWIGALTARFLFGAAGGGLLFGWLGDRIGRVSSMAISIFVYSVFTGGCYFARQPWHLGTLRFFAALGMGGEWALGVALVMECWPDRFRPLLAGLIGAAGNVGYLMISLLAMTFQVTAGSWRWTMLACSSPAILALGVVLFLPESSRWKEAVKKETARPLREIFSSRLLKTTLLGILISSIPLIGTWAAVSAFLPAWVDQLVGAENPYAKGTVQVVISLGAIVGCLLGLRVAAKFGRRPAYFGLCAFFLPHCGSLVPQPHLLQHPPSGNGRIGGLRDGLVFRLAAVVSARTFSHSRSRNRPGLVLQCRPRLRRARIADDRSTVGVLPRQLCPCLRRHQRRLPPGNGGDLVCARNQRQALAGIKGCMAAW